MPELNIDTDKVCYLIIKAREFDVLVPSEGNYEGSDAADDKFMSVLEDTPDNPIDEELDSFFANLNEDELTEILVLLMLGRGDYALDDWADAEAAAKDMRDERKPAALLGIPQLADHLEDGLAELGLSCESFEMGHL